MRTGGRYVYVVNKGGGASSSASGSLPCGTSGGIAEFAVGGQGVLTFQQCFQSQGTTPVWAARDSTGGFLYVLDSVGRARTAMRIISTRLLATAILRCSRLTRAQDGCRSW